MQKTVDKGFKHIQETVDKEIQNARQGVASPATGRRK